MRNGIGNRQNTSSQGEVFLRHSRRLEALPFQVFADVIEPFATRQAPATDNLGRSRCQVTRLEPLHLVPSLGDLAAEEDLR